MIYNIKKNNETTENNKNKQKKALTGSLKTPEKTQSV